MTNRVAYLRNCLAGLWRAVAENRRTVVGGAWRCTFSLLGLALIFPAGGLELQGVKLDRFKTRSAGAELVDAWELEGKQAVMAGSTVQLRQAELRLRLADGQTAVVTTPECRFDDRDKTLRGQDWLQIRHPAFWLAGVGYTGLVGQHRLNIHAQVEMEIYHAATGGRSIFAQILPDRLADRPSETISQEAPPDGHDVQQP